MRPCDKFTYSYAEAHRRARNKRRYREERIHAYYCRRCGGWHLGHPPQKIKPKLPVRK